jgi:hypothetical protein
MAARPRLRRFWIAWAVLWALVDFTAAGAIHTHPQSGSTAEQVELSDEFPDEISRRPSGVFVANRRVPSGESASARVGIVSKFRYGPPCAWAVPAPIHTIPASRAPRASDRLACQIKCLMSAASPR